MPLQHKQQVPEGPFNEVKKDEREAAEKDKKLTKDELESANAEVQKLVDKYNETADNLSAQKEKEVMEV